MTRVSLLLGLFWGLTLTALAQHGSVYDNLSMTSDILDSERKYAVYLPPDYDSSERSYPVLYLLHGGGSFMYALHRPDLSSSAAPLSASVGSTSIQQFRERMDRRGIDISGVPDPQIKQYISQHNAISLVESLPVDDIKSVRWFIDCGDDDFLYEGNSLVHIALRKREVPHEFRIRDGGHTWTYWRESLPVVLEFISQAFHQF